MLESSARPPAIPSNRVTSFDAFPPPADRERDVIGRALEDLLANVEPAAYRSPWRLAGLRDNVESNESDWSAPAGLARRGEARPTATTKRVENGRDGQRVGRAHAQRQ